MESSEDKQKLGELMESMKQTKAAYDKQIQIMKQMNEKFQSGLRVLDNMKKLYADSLSELMDKGTRQ